MARIPRIHYEGAFYHVICRGNNRNWIFDDEVDKDKYLEIIGNYKKKYGFKCYAFCVMGNHVHLLIEVNKVPLSKIMQGVQQVYTQYYNKSHNRVGHVFSQRYKAILCNKDAYLLMLIRYIHQNPLRAGIDEGVDYSWSSHQYYTKGVNNEVVDTDFPLKMFDEKSKTSAIQKYLNFVYEDDGVINTIKASEFSEGTKANSTSSDSKMIKHTLEELLVLVAEFTGITTEELISKRRYKKIVYAKKLLIRISSDYTKFSQVEVANVLGVSQALVSKVLRNEDEQLSESVGELLKSVSKC